MDRAGGILAFGRDGQQTWSIKLGAEVVGQPQVLGRSLAILTSDGVLHLRDRSDGAPLDRRPLGVLPAGGPARHGPGGDDPGRAGNHPTPGTRDPGSLQPLAEESYVAFPWKTLLGVCRKLTTGFVGTSATIRDVGVVP